MKKTAIVGILSASLLGNPVRADTLGCIAAQFNWTLASAELAACTASHPLTWETECQSQIEAFVTATVLVDQQCGC